MKKIFLTLALIFIFGTSCALANPFTDLPANHWAYASVAKLAQAGIVDGYGDGKFIGNSSMTRYEMAQIVAKAMANSDKADNAAKAQIQKLAAEFSQELDKLGLKVSKLEKNSDNVRITGEVRFASHSYGTYRRGSSGASDTEEFYSLRSRIWLTGQVNDAWQYTAMLQNEQDFRTNNQETTTDFMRAYVQGKVGVLNITAGRLHYLSQYGTVLDADADGLVLGFARGKFAMDVFALRPTMNPVPNVSSINKFYTSGGFQKTTQIFGSQLNYNFTDKLHSALTYYKINGVGDSSHSYYSQFGKVNTSIIELGVDYKFDQNWFVWANYLRGGKAPAAFLAHEQTALGGSMFYGSSNGWAAGVKFGKVDRNKQGSYQLRLSYYDVPYAGSINTETIELASYNFNPSGTGFQGWVLGGSYMLAKNIDFNVDYYDFKSQTTKNGDKAKQNLLFSYVRFYF